MFVDSFYRYFRVKFLCVVHTHTHTHTSEHVPGFWSTGAVRYDHSVFSVQFFGDNKKRLKKIKIKTFKTFWKLYRPFNYYSDNITDNDVGAQVFKNYRSISLVGSSLNQLDYCRKLHKQVRVNVFGAHKLCKLDALNLSYFII